METEDPVELLILTHLALLTVSAGSGRLEMPRDLHFIAKESWQCASYNAWQWVYIPCRLQSSKWLIRALIFHISVKFLTLVCVRRLIEPLEIAVKPPFPAPFIRKMLAFSPWMSSHFPDVIFVRILQQMDRIAVIVAAFRHCYYMSSLLPIVVTACRHCYRLSSLLLPVVIVNFFRHC